MHKTKAVAKRVHVRANTMVAEQVPGSTNLLPSLDNGEALGPTMGLQVICGANAGQASPNKEHVNTLISLMFNCVLH
jgi:hypothetical protein